ncbi:hypothetical protein KQX54_009448 [Cotesia glomerata]|uniref:Complex I-MWFE n=1 Tax=Cotesia glomerata TaxID=32391 RepID=A0AAV7IEC3_COTGL|nr:hypothetical protein KQX54_009448 [Cotesia glomerata]
MWWECIPSGAIIVICLALPQYSAWYFNKAVYGNHYRRSLESTFDRNMFSRDSRVGGAPWILKGLESLPDE